MKKLKTVNLLLVLLFAIVLTGCSDQKTSTNASINENVNLTKLAHILKNPSDFVDKNIVVEGNFFPVCADSCCDDEFVLRDGMNQIKIIKKGDIKIPKFKNAQPIRVTGILKTTVQSPFIQATAIEVR